MIISTLPKKKGSHGCFKKVSYLWGNATGTTFGVYLKDFYHGVVFKVRGLHRRHKVSDMKFHIQVQIGIPMARQRLYMDGLPLEDGETLASRAVVRHSTVVLVRLPELNLPSATSIFSNGDKDKGKINLGFLWEHFHQEGRLSAAQSMAIVSRCTEILKKESNVLRVEEPITVVTDLHGQFFDLKTIFERGGHWDNTTYLFLGDYVDRGAFSVELTLFVFACKVNYSTRFNLLRGNHESVSTTKRMGFLEECQVKFGVESGNEVYQCFMGAFTALPIAAILKCGGKKIFCTHGGVSIDAQRVEDIERVNRFVEPTSDPILRDLLWADPADTMIALRPVKTDINLSAIREKQPRRSGAVMTTKMFTPSARGGVVKIFSHEALCSFLESNDFLTLLRGHQQKPGFEFHTNGLQYDFPAAITLFSAPNYTDHSKNTGGIAIFAKGVMRIVEYEWRLHPMYTSSFVRDVEREDFHQFVDFTDESALIGLTEEQLDHAFKGLIPRRIFKADGSRDLWGILRHNLGRVPELSGRVTRMDSMKRTKGMIAWFSAMDHLSKALQKEESYELYYEDENLGDLTPHRIDPKDPGSLIKFKLKRELAGNMALKDDFYVDDDDDDDEDYDDEDYSYDSYYSSD